LNRYAADDLGDPKPPKFIYFALPFVSSLWVNIRDFTFGVQFDCNKFIISPGLQMTNCSWKGGV